MKRTIDERTSFDELRPVARYRICGIRFFQRELTIAEDIEIGPLIAPILKFQAVTLGEWIEGALQILGDGRQLESIFSILLKVDEPTIFHRFRNSYHAWRRGVKLHGSRGVHVLQRMAASQVVEVLLDFFVFNGRWMEILPVSSIRSMRVPAKPSDLPEQAGG